MEAKNIVALVFLAVFAVAAISALIYMNSAPKDKPPKDAKLKRQGRA